MEFYSAYKILLYTFRGVSIPNGMEFYPNGELLNVAFAVCFNSQRDGILPNTDILISDDINPFQFPTGWNSTDGANFVNKPD